ncbi:MAG: hypothetical protein HC906_16755 [Bacteroidales bacterium]|nr:hypothetical protein [Bacteroidales bacterium]
MAGIPMEIVPEYPSEGKLIILTEAASYDENIVEKIKKSISAGGNVVITSGLLKALQGKGIEQIAELRYTDRKSLASGFLLGRTSIDTQNEIIIPQIEYYTNDSWEVISAMDNGLGWPLLHRADYSKGNLFVLVIPDNFADIYALPEPVLNKIREVLSVDLPVFLNAPSQVSLFLYDNNTFVVHSFNNEPVDIQLVLKQNGLNIKDLSENTNLKKDEGKTSTQGNRNKLSYYSSTIQPHSFKVFKIE